MANAFEAKSDVLVATIAAKLKEKEVPQPAYVPFVKTGAGKERVPSSPDFWYFRCASVLRQVYVNGPIGISKLRTKYGTKKGHVTHRHHHIVGGGSIIKDAFDALEKLNFVKKTKEGRIMTSEGRSFVDKISNELNK